MDRLSPLDVSFPYFEDRDTPMHVGSVAVFQEPDDGFDHDGLVEFIGDRIAYVPRYRQQVRHIPGRLANPIWVDDREFDLGHHISSRGCPTTALPWCPRRIMRSSTAPPRSTSVN
jgi:diacylglycerol O-acyltransferase